MASNIVGDVMTRQVIYLPAETTLDEAAAAMRDQQIGDVVVTEGPTLAGMVTDRDIVVKVLAAGKDPASTTVLDLTRDQGEVVTIGADDPVEEIARTMSEHQVRRLPVIDGHDLIGIVSQADVARNLPEEKIGDLVEAISSAPSNG